LADQSLPFFDAERQLSGASVTVKQQGLLWHEDRH